MNAVTLASLANTPMTTDVKHMLVTMIEMQNILDKQAEMMVSMEKETALLYKLAEAKFPKLFQSVIGNNALGVAAVHNRSHANSMAEPHA